MKYSLLVYMRRDSNTRDVPRDLQPPGVHAQRLFNTRDVPRDLHVWSTFLFPNGSLNHFCADGDGMNQSVWRSVGPRGNTFRDVMTVIASPNRNITADDFAWMWSIGGLVNGSITAWVCKRLQGNHSASVWVSAGCHSMSVSECRVSQCEWVQGVTVWRMISLWTCLCIHYLMKTVQYINKKTH